MARFKNIDWNLTKMQDGGIQTWEQAGIAVMMDIRDELKALNALLGCSNCVGIPRKLDRIRVAVEGMRRDKTTRRKRVAK